MGSEMCIRDRGGAAPSAVPYRQPSAIGSARGHGAHHGVQPAGADRIRRPRPPPSSPEPDLDLALQQRPEIGCTPRVPPVGILITT